MRVKNQTPLWVGFKVVARKAPTHELMVVVRGRFRLRPGEPVEVITDLLERGFLSGDRFDPDDDERTGALLHPSDFADLKPSAEVMLVGSAHPPGGAPVPATEVAFGVGSWDKRLWVVGDRAWTGGTPGPPAPFTVMPITWDRALGGPDDRHNPVGKGRVGDAMPNVELPGRLLRSRADHPPAAGFGPLSPCWEPRHGLYKRAYTAESAPFLAPTFDPSTFYAAPADQRLPGFLVGDEEVRLERLVAGHERLVTRLPGLRPRVFVHDTAEAFREVSLRCDTLLVEADQGTLMLVWRGYTPVESPDLWELTSLLTACERLAEPPGDVDVYRQELEAFERDPVGAMMPDDPPEAAAMWKATRDDAGRRGQPVSTSQGPGASSSQSSSGAGAGAGAGPTPRPRAVSSSGSSSGSGGEGGMSPLEKLLAASLFVVPEASRGPLMAAVRRMRNHKAPTADGGGSQPLGPMVDAAMRNPKREGPPAVGGRDPRAGGAIAAAFARLREARARAVERGETREVAAIDAALEDPRLQALDPAGRAFAEGQPMPEPGPGVDLRGRDLSEQDLSGRDLSGADLGDANLTRTRLVGANLSGARLEHALLFEADASEANLSEANLTRAVLVEADLHGADLSRARLDGVFGDRVNLVGARLDDAIAELPALLSEADLSGVHAHRVRLIKAYAPRCRLDAADLRCAVLDRCCFTEASAVRIDLRGASAEGTSFGHADLTGALALGLQAEGSVWLSTALTDADFRLAVLGRSTWRGARAPRTRFECADLAHAQLTRVHFASVAFEGANLAHADFRHSLLQDVRFQDANLYASVFVHATLERCQLDRANLSRSTIEDAR